MKEKRGGEEKSQNYVSKEKGTRLIFSMYCNDTIAPQKILIFESLVYKKKPMLPNYNEERPLFPPLLNLKYISSLSNKNS